MGSNQTPVNVRAQKSRLFLAGMLTEKSTPEEENLSELHRLVKAAGAHPSGMLLQKRNKIDPTYFFGKGKIQEIKESAERAQADALVVDNDLSPAQLRNIEEELDMRVLDRTELILDIFALHARTAQAKLQVELAQLEYLMPRLKRMWTHLSRVEGSRAIAGGVGTRGPGEKQLETDQRIIKNKIYDLRKKLKEIDARAQRVIATRREAFKIALVGYTNAGKTSLLNILTGATEFVKDMFFATLDTRTRQMELAPNRVAVVSDTVGFIRKLPHRLVEAFRATLEEVTGADLLLHVVDISHPEAEQQAVAVNAVLAELGCETKPMIVLLNKIDLHPTATALQGMLCEYPESLCVSARTGEGIGDLRRLILERMELQEQIVDVVVDAGDGKSLAWLNQHLRVIKQEYGEATVRLRIKARPDHIKKIKSMGLVVQ